MAYDLFAVELVASVAVSVPVLPLPIGVQVSMGGI